MHTIIWSLLMSGFRTCNSVGLLWRPCEILYFVLMLKNGPSLPVLGVRRLEFGLDRPLDFLGNSDWGSGVLYKAMSLLKLVSEAPLVMPLDKSMPLKSYYNNSSQYWNYQMYIHIHHKLASTFYFYFWRVENCWQKYFLHKKHDSFWY